jgi:plasmid stabilization system protein ParE
VSLYRLTPSAIDDIDQAISYLASRAGWTIALKVEQELFDVFEKLAAFPGLGTGGPDLNSGAPYLDSEMWAFERSSNPRVGIRAFTPDPPPRP